MSQALDGIMEPLGLLDRWPVDQALLLLHSGRPHPRWARQSLVASPTAIYRYVLDSSGQGESRWWSRGGEPAPVTWSHRPLRDLRRLLEQGDDLWIGHLSYDLGRYIERLPSRAGVDRSWPIIELARCPGWLTCDTTTGQWRGHGTWREGLPFDLTPPAGPGIHKDAPPALRAADLTSTFDARSYQAAVAKALEYIAAGDIFQVNLSQRFSTQFAIGGEHARCVTRRLYRRLAAASPAWYGAYLEQSDGRAIASTSPELFLEVDAASHVITRPIKGTRPASADPHQLLHSEKDQAELHMIVDLLRNDLGRVCEYGSVRVTQPRTIESHPTVHHGVATIEGTLHTSKDIIDLLQATMPGGSITGAPKIRAMQIIEQLEPVRRGPYCGAIGYLSRSHGSCLNIAIRTMLIEPTAPPECDAASDQPAGLRVDFSVGGGIVADSDPADEYQETLDKAAAMLQALDVGPVSSGTDMMR